MNQCYIEAFKAERPLIPDKNFDIKQFGALGDGIKLNTYEINQAIEACEAEGGGKVIIPQGIWLTGPIRLRSNVNLHLEEGALVLFSSNMDDYPLIQSSFEGLQAVRCQSPLDGEGLENIAVTGKGVFDGGGEAWRPVKKFKMTDTQWLQRISSHGVVDKDHEIWWPSKSALKGAELVPRLQNKGSLNISDYEEVKDFLRPNLLSLRHCKNILIEGPTFQNSPAWCLHPWVCEHVTIRNVTVRNPWFSQNGDGLDIESCRYVEVENCTFDVGDDAICIKSGKNEEGRKLGIPCRDIKIKNCIVYSGHGGFVVGSEMSGGVKNVHVSDCTFFGTDTGLRFKSTRGRGGTVEQIFIDTIKMKGIKKEAIVFHLFYEAEESQVNTNPVPISERTPIFRNIKIKNVICIESETAILLKGLPEQPLQHLTFENIFILSQYGINCLNVHHSTFINVNLQVKEGDPIVMRDCQHITRK